MLYLLGEKVCICGLAEVFSPQITKKLCPPIAYPQVSHLRKVCKCNKLLRSENLRNCDLRNLTFGPPIFGKHTIYIRT
jgi:hypothetical protein